MPIIDYHTHSTLSFDGVSDLESIVKSAVKKGIYEFCITEHCECVEFGVDEHPYNFEKSFELTTMLKEKYKDKISLKFGVEIGQATQKPDYARAIMQKKQFDFIIGSLHSMKNTLDFYYLDYSTVDVKSYVHRYYDELLELVEFSGFDVVGHLTYPFRYGIIQNIPMDISLYMPQIEQVLKKAVEKNIGIEVNTSGLRQKTNIFMPELGIVRLYKQLGGEIITLGSDSHTDKDIGANISDGQEMIKRAGFDYVTIFDKRQPKQIKI